MATSSIFLSANLIAARVPSPEFRTFLFTNGEFTVCVRGGVPAQCYDREGIWLPLCPSATGLEITLGPEPVETFNSSRARENTNRNSRLKDFSKNELTTLTNEM